MAGVILVAAGGTGGHLFPAEALAVALAARGWRVHLATDHRVESYGQDFPAERIHVVPSATITKAPIAAARSLATLAGGLIKARRLVRRIAPAAAIGFGGYPTVPPILAASQRGVPTVVHDANAVLGRANRFLATRATAIATSFPAVGGLEKLSARVVETGNPVRAAVRAAASIPYLDRWAGDPFRLLVFGGSQGARFFSEALPPALGKLPGDLRARLKVVQQAREEDIEALRAAYAKAGIDAEIAPFFRDLPERIAKAQLVIARAGASTVAELTTIGRPALLVPLPHALDNDQLENATRLEQAGGGWCVKQSELTDERLARLLQDLLSSPERLAKAAEKSHAMATPDAVKRLADMVEALVKSKEQA
jgi:UDP-N-acetylglucosamine--N-acetylmuramyl-(pentapeptide) pyrophosphoryl-undecaprenol N-acetylglucosamine transferase